MGKIVFLDLGSGSLMQGLDVRLRIKEEESSSDILSRHGRLPPSTELSEYYHKWRSAYRRLESNWRLGGRVVQPISIKEINDAAQNLKESLNRWLKSPDFTPLKERLLERLDLKDKVQVIIQSNEDMLQRLPWQEWEFFNRYHKAQVALSSINCETIDRVVTSRSAVRILAILGNSKDIDITKDRQELENLPDAEPIFLPEPERGEVEQQLWDKKGWDILFFAGHSLTEDTTGRIYINQKDSLTIGELKYALKKAIERGLHLAIFNSCDGLGLAQQLADLHIPQIILMREPVPDKVAQEFLKHFLKAFASGESLHLAVREAREKLQGLEIQFPCATWLPTICQNPAEGPKLWQDFLSRFPDNSPPDEEPVGETQTAKPEQQDVQQEEAQQPEQQQPTEATPLKELDDLSSDMGVDYSNLQDLLNEPDDLSSDWSVDYSDLRNLLNTGNWQEANQKTQEVILDIADRKEEGWLNSDSQKYFPRTDLDTIDTLWVRYSRGRFGFSVQKRILESVKQNEQEFSDRVGWRLKRGFLRGGIFPFPSNDQLTFTLEAPEGHLPLVFGGEHFWIFTSLPQRQGKI